MTRKHVRAYFVRAGQREKSNGNYFFSSSFYFQDPFKNQDLSKTTWFLSKLPIDLSKPILSISCFHGSSFQYLSLTVLAAEVETSSIMLLKKRARRGTGWGGGSEPLRSSSQPARQTTHAPAARQPPTTTAHARASQPRTTSRAAASRQHARIDARAHDDHHHG